MMEITWEGFSIKVTEGALNHLLVMLDIAFCILAVYAVRKVCGTTTTDFIKNLFGEIKSIATLKYTASSINGLLVLFLGILTVVLMVSSPVMNVLKVLGHFSSNPDTSISKTLEMIVFASLTAVAGLLSVKYISKSEVD
jgi:hypothetical protein